MGYQYLKLRASRYPSHRFAAGPSRSQAHGRPWFLIPISQKVPCTEEVYHKYTEGAVLIVLFYLLHEVYALTDLGFNEIEITVGNDILGSELRTQTYAGNTGLEPGLKAGRIW